MLWRPFLEANEDNPDVIASVTTNPFPAHLNIRVSSLDRTEEVASYLRSKGEMIESIDDSKEFLLGLNRIVLGIQLISLVLLSIFTLSTFFVIVLAIGITVYSQKK